jgi:glycosyltransferase involved in cell wall biosynthesis
VKVLFIHQNFPGQFGHLAADLARDPANQVVALTMSAHPAPAGVAVRRYALLRPSAPETHPLLAHQESHVLRAEACASAAFQLRNDGFTPDVIVAHPGWGEALFIKDVFPQARLVVYCEFYYALEGQDIGFDPQEPAPSFAQRCMVRLKNTTNLLSMEIADAAISPTQWQKNTYPQWARQKIEVIHDGIDLAALAHDPDARLSVGTAGGGQLTFQPGEEVLSYVARNLEPVRGFPVFMRTLPEVLRRRPKAHAIVVGGDQISYGRAAPNGRSWKEHMLAEVGGELDLTRVHFLGQVSYQRYLQLLSISRVHAYWTTPFVLSWSFLEAALGGLPVVASDTAPVREFAPQLGVDTIGFFDQQGFASALCGKLANPTHRSLERTALASLDVRNCIAAQSKLIRSI